MEPTSVVPSQKSTDPVTVPDVAVGVAVSVTVWPEAEAVSAVVVATFATVTGRAGETEPV